MSFFLLHLFLVAVKSWLSNDLWWSWPNSMDWRKINHIWFDLYFFVSFGFAWDVELKRKFWIKTDDIRNENSFGIFWVQNNKLLIHFSFFFWNLLIFYLSFSIRKCLLCFMWETGVYLCCLAFHFFSSFLLFLVTQRT